MNRHLAHLFVLTVCAVSTLVAQTIVPGGDVYGTWSVPGSPYLVTGDITIPDDSTLTIAPGVRVEFQGHYALYISGRLLAIGTETDTIVFTVNDTTGFSNPDTTLGGWYGIRMLQPDSTNDSTIVAYCRLSHGKAIGPNWPFNHGGAICIVGFDKVRISNCLIADNLAGGPEYPSGGGLGFSQADILVVGNTFVYNRAMYGGGANGQSTRAHLINNRFLHNSAREAGGLGLAWSEPELVQNLFAGNHASFGGAVTTAGSSPHLFNNVFTDNTAITGGALAFAQESSAALLGDTIRNNTAEGGWGGGIYVLESGATLKNVVISGNMADTSGGIHAYRANLIVDSCLIERNTTTVADGGGLGYGCDTFIPGRRYHLELSGTRFIENTAAAIGGGVLVNQATSDTSLVTLLVDRCEFRGNTARSLGAFRVMGKIEDFFVLNSTFTLNTVSGYGSGTAFSSKCRGVVANCLFARNESGTGGGGALGANQGAEVDIVNCTFAHNYALTGSALRIARGGVATLTNCILWGNTGPHTILLDVDSLGGEMTINHCDIQYGTDSMSVDPLSTLTWGEGNIVLNPLFEDSGSMDYHLYSGSPCIGAAIDSLLMGTDWLIAPPLDIEGNPRPSPAGTQSDMGAYEEQVTIPVGMPQDTRLPLEFALTQNYPNPFNPSTTIRYGLPSRSHVTLSVFNTLGQKVRTLVDEVVEAGYQSVEFDASGLASGVYLYRLQAGNLLQTKRMLILR